MERGRTLTQTRDFEQFAQQVRSFFDQPLASGAVTAGVEAANKRRVTVQVIDRLKNPWPARWLTWVFLATAVDGAPDGTGNTVAFVQGDVVMTAIMNGMWLVQADADGRVVFDLTIAGAATRYVGTQPSAGIPRVSAALVWT